MGKPTKTLPNIGIYCRRYRKESEMQETEMSGTKIETQRFPCSFRLVNRKSQSRCWDHSLAFPDVRPSETKYVRNPSITGSQWKLAGASGNSPLNILKHLETMFVLQDSKTDFGIVTLSSNQDTLLCTFQSGSLTSFSYGNMTSSNA